jgi:hypothetical protein
MATRVAFNKKIKYIKIKLITDFLKKEKKKRKRKTGKGGAWLGVKFKTA